MSEKRSGCENQKIVFFGNPTIAAVALETLITMGFAVVGVVCKPEREIGRNKTLWENPVKKLANAHNIPVWQPAKLISIEPELKALNPYAFITCAYGVFIPARILQIPTFATLNLHASLLPSYRGGAPIHWAVLDGVKTTGLTIMQTVSAMDAGPIYVQLPLVVNHPLETTSSLFLRMHNLVRIAITNHLQTILDQKMAPIIQDESKVSFALNLKPDLEKINFEQTGKQLVHWINGMSDTPGAYGIYENVPIKLFAPVLLPNKSKHNPGTIVSLSPKGMVLATKDYDLLIPLVQLPNKRKMLVSELLNGNHSFVVGQQFH